MEVTKLGDEKEIVVGEIKKDLIKLDEGKPYIAGADEYVITEAHTLSDILRFLIGCTGEDGHDDIQYLLNEYK